MITIEDASAVELPVALIMVAGNRRAMKLQRWQARSVADAEILFMTLQGLLGDDPGVAAVLMDPHGRDGFPTVAVCWRSPDGALREQIRNSLYPVEPALRQVEAALEAEPHSTSVEVRIQGLGAGAGPVR